jgi:hypothetical protein
MVVMQKGQEELPPATITGNERFFLKVTDWILHYFGLRSLHL